jgi:hypothetical protein
MSLLSCNTLSFQKRIRRTMSKQMLSLIGLLLIAPLTAYAQGTPFDNGFTALQTLFTGTVANETRHIDSRRYQ